LERPDLSYSRGWSRGKEKFQGKFDNLKGSFYADPLEGLGKDLRKSGNGVQNIWPKDDLPEFEHNFK